MGRDFACLFWFVANFFVFFLCWFDWLPKCCVFLVLFLFSFGLSFPGRFGFWPYSPLQIGDLSGDINRHVWMTFFRVEGCQLQIQSRQEALLLLPLRPSEVKARRS